MSDQFFLAMLLFACSAIAALVVRNAYRLWQRYRFLFLSSFLFYLLAWNLNGMLGLLTMVVVPLVIPKPGFVAVFLVNSMLFIPLHGFVAYFFMDFSFRLLGRSLPRLLKSGFLVVFFLYFMGVMIRDLIVFSPLRTSRPLNISAHSLAVMALCIFFSLIFLHLGSRKAMKPEAFRYFLAFEWITALGFACSFLFMMDILPASGFVGKNLLTLGTVFGFHIPALWALRRHVRLQYGPGPAEQFESTDYEGFCRHFNLSQREMEVLERVLKGRSNREIEAELFISLDTVKKHLYNIYRKTGVKNRVRLAYLVSKQTVGTRGEL